MVSGVVEVEGHVCANCEGDAGVGFGEGCDWEGVLLDRGDLEGGQVHFVEQILHCKIARLCLAADGDTFYGPGLGHHQMAFSCSVF